MKNGIFPAFAMFGMSLFSIWPGSSFLPFTIAASDLVIVLILLYAIKNVGLAVRNPISNTSILLAVVLLISGIVNKWRVPTFDEGNFLLNYTRMLGLVVMALVLPPMLRRVGDDRLAKGAMFALRLHCAILLADSFHVIPAAWLPLGEGRSLRPAGLFAEPGWFGTWVGLTVFYVMQVQFNRKQQYISFLDWGLLCISIIASAGMRGIVLLGFAIMRMILGEKAKSRVKLIGGLLLMIATLSVSAMVLSPDVGLSFGLSKVQERLPGVTNLQDDSVADRLLSTTQSIIFTMNESPLVGLGLGGASQQRLPWYDSEDRVRGASGSSMMATTIFLAAGLLGLGVFLLIPLKMITANETRWFGLGFALTSLIWGGVFETFIWWFIALASALMGTHKKVKAAPLMTHSMEVLAR